MVVCGIAVLCSTPGVPVRPLSQDPTNHPIWTGEKSGMSLEDERISKVMKRYGAFLGEAGKAK